MSIAAFTLQNSGSEVSSVSEQKTRCRPPSVENTFTSLSDHTSYKVSSFGVYHFFRGVYIPFLLSKYVRPLVIVAFLLLLSSSIVVIPNIEVGLDKEVTVSESSYVYKYFTVPKFSPVIFVTRDIKLCIWAKWEHKTGIG